MGEKMRFSVVIPMYNSGDTIIETIKSIENQTKYELISEIIIVNDGSTDDSLIVVSNHTNDKIKLINICNGGAANARNIGIRETTNNYIALLDSDDVWEKNKIERIDEILNKYSEIKAIGSNRIGESIHLGKKVHEGVYRLTPFQYCLKNWPCTPSIVFDKTVFKDGYFPSDMTHAEEGIFFLYLAAHCGLYYVEDELVFCGNGKRSFGESGLSGNIQAMHNGVNVMMRKACEKGYINKLQYIFLLGYEKFKYIRRKAIVGKIK